MKVNLIRLGLSICWIFGNAHIFSSTWPLYLVTINFSFHINRSILRLICWFFSRLLFILCIRIQNRWSGQIFVHVQLLVCLAVFLSGFWWRGYVYTQNVPPNPSPPPPPQFQWSTFYLLSQNFWKNLGYDCEFTCIHFYWTRRHHDLGTIDIKVPRTLWAPWTPVALRLHQLYFMFHGSGGSIFQWFRKKNIN